MFHGVPQPLNHQLAASSISVEIMGVISIDSNFCNNYAAFITYKFLLYRRRYATILSMKASTIAHTADVAGVHFWPGWLDVAFVFSAPGTFEADWGKPVAGVTGEHLDLALVQLASALPEIFPSAQRYDYRITNAYPAPLSHARGDARTEAAGAAITARANVARVREELHGCRLVVLCGNKAGLLRQNLRDVHVLVAGHTSMNGLNARWPDRKRRLVDPAWDSKSGAQRTTDRIALWARDVECQARALPAAGALSAPRGN